MAPTYRTLQKRSRTFLKALAFAALILAPRMAHAILGAPAGEFISNQSDLQSGAVFHVASGTVVGPFTVSGSTAIFRSTMTFSGARPVSMSAPTNGQVLKWNSTTGFWEPGADNSGGGTTIAVQVDDANVDVSVSTIDFSSADFSVTSSPAGEANFSLVATNPKFIQNRNTLQSGATFYVPYGIIEGFFNVISSYTGSGELPVQLQNKSPPAVNRTFPLGFYFLNSTNALERFATIEAVTREVTTNTVNGKLRLGIAKDSANLAMLEMSSEASEDYAAFPTSNRVYFGTTLSTGAYLQSSGTNFTIGLGSTTGTKTLNIGDGNGNVGQVDAVWNTGTNDGTISWVNSSNQFSTSQKFVFNSSMTLSGARLVKDAAPSDQQVLGWSAANSRWEPLTQLAANAILNQNTLQSGATFYVSSGTVEGGDFTVRATTDVPQVNNLHLGGRFYASTFGVLKQNEGYLYNHAPHLSGSATTGRLMLYASTIPISNNLQWVDDGSGYSHLARGAGDTWISIEPSGTIGMYPNGNLGFGYSSNRFALFNTQGDGGLAMDVGYSVSQRIGFHLSTPAYFAGGAIIDANWRPDSIWNKTFGWGRMDSDGSTDLIASITSGQASAENLSIRVNRNDSYSVDAQPDIRVEIEDNCSDCNTKFTDNIEVRKTYGEGALRFYDSDASHYVAWKASETVTSTMTLVLPAGSAPSVGQVLEVAGVSGTRINLAWATDDSGGGGSSTLAVQDEGVNVSSPTSTINFVGAGVTVTLAGTSSATVTIPGGGSDNLGNHVATMTLTAGFGINTSTVVINAPTTNTVPLVINATTTSSNITEWKAGSIAKVFISTRPVRSSFGDNYYLGFSPGGGRQYRIGTYDAGGTMMFSLDQFDNALQFTPAASNVALSPASGYIYVRGNTTAGVVITPTEGGGTGILRIGQRPSDSSTGVGGSVEFWTNTGQTLPAWGVMAPGGATFISSMSAAGNLTLPRMTATYGVTAASYTIRGTHLFVSTPSVTAYSGYVMYLASGPIAANTAVTISTTNMNVSALGLPICAELEGVNTAAVSVRVQSISGLPNSFTVYNADVINNKNYICYVAGKPL